ncbi:hypothetical protein CASFOL_016560 [Castilleja foliolosa]|uniref:Uncharacterized protein n=1 Tax=Castilleja foliolosa TaxID=1961234 RepID=A0ABD3D8J7_9LAMI
MGLEIRVPSYCQYRLASMAKKNPGNSSNSNSNSFSSSETIKTPPPPRSKPLPLKWTHPITAPEKGSLLVATEKLDGVRTFERTVILILRSGTKNPQEGPYGVIINRPLNKKMKHMNPTNIDLGTKFADYFLHFGGPLMFLLRADETTGLRGFEEVIPGLYFGSRNSLDEAFGLVKSGARGPRYFRFFMGYAGWQMDQLVEEIEADCWYVAACSETLISGISQNLSTVDLWEEVLGLMGGIIRN